MSGTQKLLFPEKETPEPPPKITPPPSPVTVEPEPEAPAERLENGQISRVTLYALGYEPTDRRKKPLIVYKTIVAEQPVKTGVGRPSQRLTPELIKKVIELVDFDMKKQGKILRWACPVHGKAGLEYRMAKGDGAHAWCTFCGKTTHWDLYHFDGGENEQNED